MNDKNGVYKCKQYLILEEAILESIEIVNLTDIRIALRVSEWNFTKTFYSEWNIPTESADARKALSQMFPGMILVILCINCALLKFDRAIGQPGLLLVQQTRPNTPDAEAAPKTIVGLEFEDESELKRMLLGEYDSRFTHLAIDIISGRIDIVFQDLAMDFPSQI
jgi:hypothetical protein